MSSGMRNNTYVKPSGKKVTVPSRLVNSKATAKSEQALGTAQDTGRGRGPLRGVARRARDGKMADMTDAQIKAKYPSQNVDKSSARGRARVENSVKYSVLTPPKAVPIKTRNLGGISGVGGASVGGMYKPMGGGGMNWQTK